MATLVTTQLLLGLRCNAILLSDPVVMSGLRQRSC